MDSLINLASAEAQGMRLHARKEHRLFDRAVGAGREASASRSVQIAALALSIVSIVSGLLTIGHILYNTRQGSTKQKAKRFGK